MKQNYAHIAFLVDRSGSMALRWNQTITALANFFQEQRQVPGEATVSLATFDSRYKSVLDFVSVNEVGGLRDIQAPSNGNTALYDAFCQMVDATGVKLGSLNENERPSKVIFVIVTDGMENASRTFNLRNVQDRMEHQKEIYSWNFVFLGADFDAVTQSRTLGGSLGFNYGSADTDRTYRNLSTAVSQYRNSNRQRVDEASFTESLSR